MSVSYSPPPYGFVDFVPSISVYCGDISASPFGFNVYVRLGVLHCSYFRRFFKQVTPGNPCFTKDVRDPVHVSGALSGHVSVLFSHSVFLDCSWGLIFDD